MGSESDVLCEPSAQMTRYVSCCITSRYTVTGQSALRPGDTWTIWVTVFILYYIAFYPLSRKESAWNEFDAAHCPNSLLPVVNVGGTTALFLLHVQALLAPVHAHHQLQLPGCPDPALEFRTNAEFFLFNCRCFMAASEQLMSCPLPSFA